MPFEKFDLENLDKERRKAIANSIRTTSKNSKRSETKSFVTQTIPGGKRSFGSSLRIPAPRSTTQL